MKVVDYICLTRGKEVQQLALTEQVWNVFMFTCCIDVGEYKSHGIGSSQPSIKEQEEWSRKLSALKIDEDNDEVEGIIEMILRQVESQRIEEQLDRMIKEHP